MHVAILSDIHANIEALRAVVKACRDESIETFWCLGDIVGYGGAPNGCVPLIRRIAAHVVLGNDDAAVAGLRDYSYYFEAARVAIDIHAELLDPDHIRWLRTLPASVTLPELGVGLVHGSPGAPDEYEYLFVSEQARRLLPLLDTLQPVTFMGHLHAFKTYALSPDTVEDLPATDSLELSPERKYVISVGSVGQPRDHNNQASYVVYDTEARRVHFRRVPYDIEAAAHRILAARIDKAFAHRLFVAV